MHESTKRAGLYESLVTDAIASELERLPASHVADREKLRPAEAGDRLALHVGRLLEPIVQAIEPAKRVDAGLALTRTLIETLATQLDDSRLLEQSPVLVDSVLRAILRRQPDGTPEPIAAPGIPLLDTTLLTNSPGEPRVVHELESEIESAQQIDLVMAFIRLTGIRPFEDALRRHCEAGRPLRVLTTIYTGSTEQAALELLTQLGADVRVSYDTTGTRLHAKAWTFHRPGGMSTAYVGSSNLTHQAQTTGLEWNVRISGARNPSVVEKMEAVFNVYWESHDFETFDSDVFAARSQRSSSAATSLLSPVDIHLFAFQERLLEKIAVAREAGHHKNLLVAATGTGKTVMAAVDYARQRERLPRARLMFVAHSGEILRQSLATFRHALRDGSFGELWVGGERPTRWEHVFASIQSLNASGLDNLKPDHFDVVIFDEIHHGAAPSYERMLQHLEPHELLGLTATPERADGRSILGWFGGRIAAELRLWDAIDQHRLVPFDYYGVHDNTDLSTVRWRNGAYDVEGLTNLYTANDAWARLVLQQVEHHVGAPREMRALGFCVSVDHARFMARVFTEHGIPAAALWGDSSLEERTRVLKQLRERDINVLFSVDLFNEGLDVPNVETLLLLRPTESPVLFLQQLGRGLRKAHDKRSCLVLDFIGHQRSGFRYHARLQALLGGSRKEVERQVEQGFPFLPAGCHMQLAPVAREIVLRSIRDAAPSRWQARVEELRSLSREGPASLASYLEASGLEPEDLYTNNRSWSDLQAAAGLEIEQPGPHEVPFRRACGRLLHVDDRVRIDAYLAMLDSSTPPRIASFEDRGARLARMLVASVCDKQLDKQASLEAGIALLWEHPQVLAELRELLGLLRNQIDHQHHALASAPDVPLRVHARYSRIEILAAFAPEARAKVPAWQTGVRWLPEALADLAAFTLDKTSGQFSPTTRYKDYAISRELIHWESQNAAGRETWARYRGHGTAGTSMMLFARERADDRAFWFLGPARFVSAKEPDGPGPISITWKLEHPLPGDLFAAFTAAVA